MSGCAGCHPVLSCPVQVWLPVHGVQHVEPAAHVSFPVHGAVHHRCRSVVWLGLDEGLERDGHGRWVGGVDAGGWVGGWAGMSRPVPESTVGLCSRTMGLKPQAGLNAETFLGTH